MEGGFSIIHIVKFYRKQESSDCYKEALTGEVGDQMVTIKQIAERAGVSTATVSNVIHGNARKVSARTVERIQALMDEMGYIQEKRQGIVRGEGFKLVATIIHRHHGFENSVLSDPFYGVVTGSIEDELRQQNCYMLLYSSNNVEDISKMLVNCDVDGAIVLSSSKENCKKLYNLIRKPMVSIDAYGSPGEGLSIPNIGLEDAEGGYLMVRHLLELGYETIFMAGMENIGIDHLRWVGAQRVCRSALFSERKARLEFIELGRTQDKRKVRYQEIAKQIPFKRKTAIFFVADYLAMEALSCWAEYGIRVPQDIGVAGFDNSINAINYSIPRLTTVNQDISMKGRIAARELVAALQDPAYRPVSHKLPVSLVCRQSV